MSPGKRRFAWVVFAIVIGEVARKFGIYDNPAIEKWIDISWALLVMYWAYLWVRGRLVITFVDKPDDREAVNVS